MSRAVSFAALSLLALIGCAPVTSFVQTDSAFVAQSGASPTVFLDALPDRPYRSVGIIEVRAGDMHSLNSIVAAAQSKGAALGCDVVVQRALHRVVGALPVRSVTVTGDDADRIDPRYLGAVTGVAPAPMPPTVVPPSGSPPPASRYEYVCGVFVTATTAASASR
jgi:hypothetical protein